MVGTLNLQNLSEDDPLGMNRKAERTLDSPDSGLPPSPSPNVWVQTASTVRSRGNPVSEDEVREARLAPGPPECALHLLPHSYGEGIELDPLPSKEIRYKSLLRYDSDRHFIDDVRLQPKGLALERCSQTILALSDNTWRRYRTRLELEPRQRAERYQSTTIVYPKRFQSTYSTELHYDGRRMARRFLSSVELEATDCGIARLGTKNGQLL